MAVGYPCSGYSGSSGRREKAGRGPWSWKLYRLSAPLLGLGTIIGRESMSNVASALGVIMMMQGKIYAEATLERVQRNE